MKGIFKYIATLSVVFMAFALTQTAVAGSRWLDPTHPEFTVSWKDCSIYGNDANGNPNRIYLEAQSWWQPVDGATSDHNGDPIDDFGHVHSGTCFPVDGEVTGDLPIKLLITVHDFDPESKFDYTRPHIFGYSQLTGGSTYNVSAAVGGNAATSVDGMSIKSGGGIRINGIDPEDHTRPRLSKVCEVEDQADETTCTIGMDLILDTTAAPMNGYQEFRFFVSLREPDGQEMHTSTSFVAKLNNPGKPYRDWFTSAGDVEGRGWYTGANYIRSRITGMPNIREPINIETFQPLVSTSKGKTQGGVISRSAVHLNPNFHQNNPGVLLAETFGPMNQTIVMKDYEEFLVDGVNKLVVVVESWCDLTNVSTLDDCNCENNVNAPPGYQGDEFACTIDDQVPFDNDAQKLSGLMVQAFIYNAPVVVDPVLEFELYSVVAREPVAGESTLLIKVVSDEPVTEDVEILYNTFAGTADHQVDYLYAGSINTSQKVFMLEGETEAFISVTIKHNPEAEGDEYFFLKLNGAFGGNATIGDRFRIIANIVEGC